MTEVDLTFLNGTELAQLIRQRTGTIVARSAGADRMAELLEHNEAPDPGGMHQVGVDNTWVEFPNETSDTNDSRKRLQLYIEKNWNGIQSQLPCKGENRGRCTIYPCSEGRHVDCLIAAGPHLKIHGL